jgi:hypothetical protein
MSLLPVESILQPVREEIIDVFEDEVNVGSGTICMHMSIYV